MSKQRLTEGLLTIDSQSWGLLDVSFITAMARHDLGDTESNNDLGGGRISAEFTAKILSDNSNPVPPGNSASIELLFALRSYSGNGNIFNIRESARIDSQIIYEVFGVLNGVSNYTGVDVLLMPVPAIAAGHTYIDPLGGVVLPPLNIAMAARNIVASTYGPNVQFGNTAILPGSIFAVGAKVDPIVAIDLPVMPGLASAVAGRYFGDVIDTAVVESTIGTGGDYATIQDWIDDKRGDFVTAKVIQRGIILNDLSITSTINFYSIYNTQNENYYWHLTTNNPTDGRPGTGHKLINNLSSNNYFLFANNTSIKIDGIEFDMNNTAAYSAINIDNFDMANVQRCLIHSGYCDAGTGYIIVARGGHLGVFANNIIQNYEFDDIVSYGFFSWNYDYLYLMNNICYNTFSNLASSQVLGFAGYVQAGAIAYIKNNISVDNIGQSFSADYSFNLSGGTYYIDNNISGDATAPGNNPIINKTPAELFYDHANGDFYPIWASPSKDGGVPASDQAEPLTIDNISRPLNSIWDIGPYEFFAPSQAAIFNGSNSYIRIADQDEFSFGDGSNDSPFTITAWINMDDSDKFIIISKASGLPVEWSFQTAGGSINNYLYMYLWDSVNLKSISVNSAFGLEGYAGKWIFVGASYNGSGDPNDINLWLNGSSVLTTKYDDPGYVAMSNGATPVDIGRNNVTYCNGKIYDLRIHNINFSLSQMQDQYRNHTVQSGLIARYLLGSNANDSGPNGFNGTPYNITYG